MTYAQAERLLELLAVIARNIEQQTRVCEAMHEHVVQRDARLVLARAEITLPPRPTCLDCDRGVIHDACPNAHKVTC